MKYYFIVNPVAGKGDGEKTIIQQLSNNDEYLKNPDNFIIVKTSEAGQATSLVKDICEENREDIIIFACGGDGTCFEVLNGIVGYDNVRMGIIPVGSCNDFLKTFPECDFLNINKQITSDFVNVDLIKANGEYVLNVTNFGFDARANRDQIKYRSKFKTVKKAYNYALFRNIISPKLGDKVEVYVDDKKIFSGKMLLSSIANAKYYGGGYKCAPLADYSDGLLEICIVKKVSIITFARLVKYYKLGQHLENPKLRKFVTYLRGKKIIIKPVKELVGCFDGETRVSRLFELEVIHNKIKFIVPR